MIQDFVNTDADQSIRAIEKQLKSHEVDVVTRHLGIDFSHEFNEKMAKLDSSGPLLKEINDLFNRFSSHKVSGNEYLLIGASLLYFVNVFDVIPDYVFAIGYLDDLIAVRLTLTKLGEKIGSRDASWKSIF